MKKIISILVMQLLFLAGYSQVTVTNLLTENRTNPMGVDAVKPCFRWQLFSDKRNVLQTAYEIRLMFGKDMYWASDKINSDQSVQVGYRGKALQSGEKYSWKVKVWDNKGKASAWSAPSEFQMALLNNSDWKAKWITPGYEEDSLRASPLFRKQFNSNKKIVRATAYVTSHGLYQAQINGKKVGDAYLTPGWTSYNKRLQYQTYDVTNLLKNGSNAIGVTLGSGWYRGIIGFTNSVNVYGKDIALLFQLDIKYSDGSTESVVSDGSWKSSTGSIVYAEIYNGETIDARKEKTGWELPGYNDAAWTSVKVADFSKESLIATQNELVKKHETFTPVKIITTPKGEKVIDFGQNLVGWVMMKVKGNAGDKITLSHAEVLDKYGNFYTENLRAAKAQDTYILKGGEEESFEPHFTWQGFRYVKVEGYPGALHPENFKAVALYSDMQPTGTFTSSNPLINQLQHNIQWGQKGNFLDIPTDCPQRDERLGWTGDAQVFSRTASFNMNVNNFFAKWLKDVAADQQNGVVPFVIPNVLGAAINSTGWADVATVIPWNMYLVYGDKQILESQYGSMKAYVESIRKVANNNLWNSGFHFGDWLFYRPDDDNDGRAAVTDKYLIAQCFYAHSTQLLINAAKVLGNTEDAYSYSVLLQKIKDAFIKEYLTPNGRLVSGTQTAYVLALNFDMLPDSLRGQAALRLVDNIKSYGNHLTTGFLGTPYLCHVLTRFGYSDVAYRLLLQDTYPSWLYPVKMGATTIWERWDGEKPDSTFETPSMNSFNHYSYGAIGDWMYTQMVGLDTYEDGVGYKHIKIQPHIGGGFSFAAASLQTYYGKLSSGWKVEGDTISMDVEIPANTTATIFVPSTDVDSIIESTKPLSKERDIKIVGKEDDYIVLNVGSGVYHFSTKKQDAADTLIDLDQYQGKYEVKSGMIKMVEIKVQGGKLIAVVFDNSGEIEPVKNIKDQFTSRDGSTVNFIRDETGNVVEIIMNALGMTFEGKKQ
jgi:alpha-L-rhamnosidase